MEGERRRMEEEKEGMEGRGEKEREESGLLPRRRTAKNTKKKKMEGDIVVTNI